MTETSQQDRAIALLAAQGMARLSELLNAGITAATISRMKQKGSVVRLARGLYQLPDAPLDTHHTLAEAGKLVPEGVICLQSALAFHDLIDRIPPVTWMAIGPKDWRPRIASPPIQIMRFNRERFKSGVESHIIEGVPVLIYGVAKSIVDMFHHRRIAGLLYDKTRERSPMVAIEALQTGLKERKTTPAEIARFAIDAGPRTWDTIRLCLETLAVGG
jgi:predicted transcriptional regulator of viral defense system